MANPATPTLLPDPTCLHLTCLQASQSCITAIVTTISSEACCPLCQCRSESIHSHYVRQVADLPWMGWAMRLELHTRRFFCRNQQCPRQIFTERLPSVVAPSARRTTRLSDVFTLIGFALGGEAGKLLMEGLGLQASPATLLRIISLAPEMRHATPRVLGVDDFSFRRGSIFGTILIDLEKRVPIDLLSDREATTLEKWLLAHPGVEIISRDRAGNYAEGSRKGAPQAQQIADRFHLLLNLSETLEDFFRNQSTALKEAFIDPTQAPPPQQERPVRPSHAGKTIKQEEKSVQLHQERVELYHRIHGLREKKADMADIARQVGVARRTVYHYLKMEQPPERTQLVSRKARPKKIVAYQGYLLRRWNEGCRNARQLHREIVEQGYTASYANVERFLGQFRTKEHKFKQEEPGKEPVVAPSTKRSPSARQVARWMTLPHDRRLDWQNAYLSRLCQAHPVIAHTAELMLTFATMLRERQGEQQLDSWLKQVEEQGVCELRSFAQGLKKDYDAVKAGLTLEWSNGQTEGQVHRLKMIKRQMYGRAEFPMLRKRVLHRA
jgi:transposase